MEMILEILFAILSTDWKKFRRASGKENEPELAAKTSG